MKMGDLHIELTADTDKLARKARIISKHLGAMADELALAAQLEEPDCEAHAKTEAVEDGVYGKCDYCGRPLRHHSCCGVSGVYCSAGCLEMAGMEQAFPVRSGCGGRWPTKKWGQSCLEDCTCIDKVVDKVILRLRDNFGMKIEG
ncbi:MAG: hypothetical protein VB144_11570 [Clostridia bacterium]|nr:hypothetical protein [Clostridia bacterium]